jgi:hypothetical protein
VSDADDEMSFRLSYLYNSFDFSTVNVDLIASMALAN